jgi:hypothetical protein
VFREILPCNVVIIQNMINTLCVQSVGFCMLTRVVSMLTALLSRVKYREMINGASSNTKWCFKWKGKRLHDDNDGGMVIMMITVGL